MSIENVVWEKFLCFLLKISSWHFCLPVFFHVTLGHFPLLYLYWIFSQFTYLCFSVLEWSLSLHFYFIVTSLNKPKFYFCCSIFMHISSRRHALHYYTVIICVYACMYGYVCIYSDFSACSIFCNCCRYVHFISFSIDYVLFTVISGV